VKIDCFDEILRVEYKTDLKEKIYDYVQWPFFFFFGSGTSVWALVNTVMNIRVLFNRYGVFRPAEILLAFKDDFVTWSKLGPPSQDKMFFKRLEMLLELKIVTLGFACHSCLTI
jgi:hypothetical protein